MRFLRVDATKSVLLDSVQRSEALIYVDKYCNVEVELELVGTTEPDSDPSRSGEEVCSRMKCLFRGCALCALNPWSRMEDFTRFLSRELSSPIGDSLRKRMDLPTGRGHIPVLQTRNR